MDSDLDCSFRYLTVQWDKNKNALQDLGTFRD
jgi:hypothetical protein